MPLFKSDDVEINYIKEGKGKPLVLIPGLGGKLTGWQQFIVPFFKEKMTVIALDNRGTGKSSRPNYPYSMDIFVSDIKNLLDYLHINEKIHLVGHSMGGMIAQHFVLKYPDRVKTLMLLATAAKYDPTPIIESQKLMEHFSEEQKFETRLVAEYSREFRKRLKLDKNLLAALKKNFTENPSRPRDFINQGAAIQNHDTRNLLKNIKQPTLIIVGNKDHIIPTLKHSELLHESIPNSTLEVLDAPGHGIIIESAEEVSNLMWNFMQRNLD